MPVTAELANFIASWTEDSNGTKADFVLFKDFLEAQEGVSLSFVPRPGITYSLRAVHALQNKRELFVMLDVIDDDPADRWLSVCFYADMGKDPEQLGDEVPEGLMGEDARCFDLYEHDDTLVKYIQARLFEVIQNAAQTG